LGAIGSCYISAPIPDNVMRLCLSMLLPLFLSLAASPTTAQKPEAGPGFTLTGNGTLIHRASRTRFPAAVAGFTRMRSKALDKKGREISVSYVQNIGGKAVIARVALIHMEKMTAKEHVVGLRSFVGTFFTDLKLRNIRPQSEGPFEVQGMNPGSAYQVRLGARVGRIPYEVSLTAVDFGYWDARLTAAYPNVVANQAQARITELVTELRKTGPKR
jgi:hypothetical protein